MYCLECKPINRSIVIIIRLQQKEKNYTPQFPISSISFIPSKMDDKQRDLSWFILKFFILSQFYFLQVLTTDEGIENETRFSERGICNVSNSNERFVLIEAHNQRQEQKISRLEASAEEDKKLINQLSGRVEQLEDLITTKSIQKSDASSDRSKRPARLLPAYLFQ